MANPAQKREARDLERLNEPFSDERPVLDEQQVLETLERNEHPSNDAPRGIAIGMMWGAAIWLALIIVYLIVR